MRAMHRLVLLVALLGWTHLPLCCGLKSLASQSESKHKVRDTVEAAIRGFEAQLAAGNLDEFSGEYALARALVERRVPAQRVCVCELACNALRSMCRTKTSPATGD
jgi:hypothetical protein